MRNCSWDTFPKTEWVTPDEICTFTVWIVEGVKEKWSRRTQNVLNVLLKSIDFFARWIFSDLQFKNKFIRIQTQQLRTDVLIFTSHCQRQNQYYHNNLPH
ncbi:hypothetical protein TorRG33x02_212150 [Trema orientale]|uniref:Uncharacterized protein n=1 Tax=Trema orientale TaxID=63057 RepID=A0A2P5EBU3_TREOI|nr:hypothetical protein TorRG33x02_212150 [Trema orientale]